MHYMYDRANGNARDKEVFAGLRIECITLGCLIDEYRITEFFSGYFANFVKHVRSTSPDIMQNVEESNHARKTLERCG
ncbi:hypothetical protein TNCV_1028531 [Trichonephila clavipes]|nr:hypothetical protein TNCV_1028531 [Trichonephila clavipes]